MKERVSASQYEREGGKVVIDLLQKHTPSGKNEPKPETSSGKAGRQYHQRDAREAFSDQEDSVASIKQQAVKRKKNPDHSQIQKGLSQQELTGIYTMEITQHHQ